MIIYAGNIFLLSNLLVGDDMNLSEQKALLRKEMVSKRLALSPQVIQEKSINFTKKFLLLDYLNTYHTFMLFMPYKNEIDTTYLINRLLSEKKRVVLPKVDKTSNTINAFEVTNLTSDLISGAYGIMEPTEQLLKILPSEIDLILLPGVAFDRKGYRLGYGGGYYDRFLLDTGAFKLGVAFEFQVIEQIPVESWDIQLDKILTDENCY